MERIIKKTDPHLFDAEVLKVQEALSYLPWLNRIYGICETLVSVREGKRFVSANHYKGRGQYEQIMPCEELGNFCFFTLRDAEEIGNRDTNLIKTPFSLILWYDMRKVSLPTDERNTEAIKSQILRVLHNSNNPRLSLEKIYEKPENVFSGFSYDHTANQYLMSPYAGLRIDGYLTTTIPCL